MSLGKRLTARTTERRRFLDYLLRPLGDAFSGAMREE